MIIRNDTIWRAGEVINLRETVQIASGATLKIEEGAVVSGGSIQVFGGLTVEGSRQNRVHFDDVTLTFGSSYNTPGRIDIAFTTMSGGSFLPATGNAGYGSFSVSDSSFNGTDGFYIWYPTSDSDFTRNTFNNSSPLSIGTDQDGTVSIESNSFVNPRAFWYEDQPLAIDVWAAYGDPVQIHHNTFSIPDGGLAIQFKEGYSSAAANADKNYWGTTDRSLIGRMILDANDSLDRASAVSIADPLTTPYTGAPVVGLIVRGTRVDDTLAGMQKSDIISGLAGDDSLDGGAGNDILNGGSGNDRLDGGTGNDRLYGQNGNDELLGGSGNDRLFGNSGKDVLKGGNGNDRLDGGTGNDRLYGQNGNDKLLGGSGNDRLFGNSGKDVLKGGSGNDRLDGGTGNDRLYGQNGNDKLLGGSGNDRLLGNSGDDLLVGGRGNDLLTGGHGSDTFVFNRGDGRDRITDFNQVSDYIEIGRGASNFDQLDIWQKGDHTIVAFADVTIVVEDTKAWQMGADDFVF